jgi:hypothetical protein
MTDTDLFFCWRTHQDVPGYVYLGDTRNGFGMLMDTGRYADGPSWTPRKRERSQDSSASCNGDGHGTSKKRVKAAPHVNWLDHLNQHRANAREMLLLAGMLGVHPDALRRLDLGYVPESESEPEHWLFPERDGNATVMGLLRRYANKKKKRMTGSQCGLLFDPAEAIADMLLIVEGPSDVAAAMTMGICAVGRPNNMGGAELLATFNRQRVTEGVFVVVLGENDRKPSGLWPGREGALHVAGHMARLLGKRMAWAMPPEGVKDLREWMWESKPDVLDREKCRAIGREILAFVRANVQWVEPPGGGGMCRNDEKEQTVSDTLSCPKLYHRYIEEEQNRYPHSLSPPAEEQTVSDTPSCPRSHSVFTDYSQWEFLGAATQDVLARGMLLKPCPKHYVPLLQGRNNPRIGLALRVDCRMYGCPVCGLRRRCRWLLHLMCIFELQVALYAAHVAADQLGALSKYVRRHEGDYVVIAQADGRILFIASCEFPGGKQVAVLEAAELVATALQNLDNAKRQPIRTSRAWALHEHSQESEFIRRGAAPTGRFGLVVKRLKRSQLGPAVQPTDQGARADWLFPGTWPDEQIEWYYEGLGSPPTSGEEEEEEEDSP